MSQFYHGSKKAPVYRTHNLHVKKRGFDREKTLVKTR